MTGRAVTCMELSPNLLFFVPSAQNAKWESEEKMKMEKVHGNYSLSLPCPLGLRHVRPLQSDQPL